EVLEAREFGDTIKRIRDLLRTVHGMEQEAARVRGAVGLLEQARQLTEDYQNSWLERTGLDYAAAAQNWQQNRKQYVAAKNKQQELQARIEDLGAEQQLNDERTQQAHRDLVQLEARRQGIPALQGKDELESRQRQLGTRLHQGVAPLLEQAHQRDINLEAVRTIQHLVTTGVGGEIPELTTHNWKTLANEVLAAEQQPVAELHQLLTSDWIDLSPLHNGLDNVRQQQQSHNRLAALLAQPGTDGVSLLQRVDRLNQERASALANLERQITASERQINTLQQSRVSYPAYVEEALAAIRQHCPAADPRVLCDHVEVTDPEWQMSIEGYLGGSRYGILVEPAHEAEAIRIVRQLSARDRSRARVIQGDMARQDAERVSLPPDSVVHVLRFSHRVAEHYVRASYASLVRVDSAEVLRQTRGGITREGMGSGNYAMFRCDIDDSQLVFG